MKIIKSVEVNKSAQQVWQIVATDFSEAGKWMSGVIHSFAHEQNNAQDTAGRTCVLDNNEDGLKAIENILIFDQDNYVLKFEIIPVKPKGPGLPVKKNVVTVSLQPSGEDKVIVNWLSEVELKPLGKLLSPLLRFGLGSFFVNVLDDLKHYAETGEVSQRKRKFDQKNTKHQLAEAK